MTDLIIDFIKFINKNHLLFQSQILIQSIQIIVILMEMNDFNNQNN